jgi:hypothetical protein
LEQGLAGQLLAAADDAAEPAVGDGHLANDAVLAGEAHLELLAGLPDVAAEQGGRSEALVLPGVLLIANAQIFGVEQPDDRGEHGLAVERALVEVLLHGAAQPGQSLAELQQAGEFGRLGVRPEIRVVAVLLAAAGVDPGRLQMAVGIGAEPVVGIGRWKTDRIQPVDRLAVGDALAFFVEIGPVAAHPLARVAGFAIAAVAQHQWLLASVIGRHKRAGEA